MKPKYNWFAVYTSSRAEKKLNSSLLEKGIECYLPLVKELRQRSDRKKWVSLPLIPSYVFVKVSEIEYYDVLNTKGAVCYITFNGKASVIPEKQIQNLKNMVNSNRTVEFTCEIPKTGDLMEVTNGPLTGVRGEVKQIRGQHRILMRFSMLGFAIHANISLDEVAQIKNRDDESVQLTDVSR